jgi:hypothetical protein
MYVNVCTDSVVAINVSLQLTSQLVKSHLGHCILILYLCVFVSLGKLIVIFPINMIDKLNLKERQKYLASSYLLKIHYAGPQIGFGIGMVSHKCSW